MLAKTPTTEMIAAELTVPERVLLFCLASGTNWVKAGVTHATAQHMFVRNYRPRSQIDCRRPQRGHRSSNEQRPNGM